MYYVQRLLKLINEQTGVAFTFVKYLRHGYNNQAVLLKDPDGKRLVVKYSLEHSTNKPVVRIFYRFKKLRRDCILNKNIKGLSKENRSFVKKTFRTPDYKVVIQDIARECSTQIYVPHIFLSGKFTFEEYCGKPITGELASYNSFEYAKDLGEFLANLHNKFCYEPSNKQIYKTASAHLNLVSFIYRLNGWNSSEISYILKDSLNKSFEYLKQCGNSDEIRTLLHNDLRKPNIVKNFNDKFVVIDWENSGINNVYNEFIQMGAYSNGMPLKFIKNVVENYNNVANSKIDMQKLKHLLILNYIDECGFRSILKRKSRADFLNIINNNAVSHINLLNTVFDENKVEKNL